MNKKEIKEGLTTIINGCEPDVLYREFDGTLHDSPGTEDDIFTTENHWYLGDYMSLDPCGKYHHFLSPNGVTKKCEKYWNDLNEIAEKLGCWIESSEDDPTDIFLVKEVNNEDN